MESGPDPRTLSCRCCRGSFSNQLRDLPDRLSYRILSFLFVPSRWRRNAEQGKTLSDPMLSVKVRVAVPAQTRKMNE